MCSMPYCEKNLPPSKFINIHVNVDFYGFYKCRELVKSYLSMLKRHHDISMDGDHMVSMKCELTSGLVAVRRNL